MHSPSGWSEPGQQPEFDEYTVVLKGTLHVESAAGSLEVHAGQAVIAHRGEWVRYSTPGPEGAEYIAVCLGRSTRILSIATRDLGLGICIACSAQSKLGT